MTSFQSYNTMETTPYCPPLAYQSVFDDENELPSSKPVRRVAKGTIASPTRSTRPSETNNIRNRSPAFRHAGDGPYPSMSTIASSSNHSIGSSGVASLVSPSKKSSSPAMNKKKKLFAPSQASIAMLNPAYAMGIDVDDAYYHQQDSAETASLLAGAGSYESLASSRSASRSASPHYQADSVREQGSYSNTPELAAFAMPDLQTALSQKQANGYDAEYQDHDHDPDSEATSYRTPAPRDGDRQNNRRRANTMASVFEDDDAHTSPKTTSPVRKVAFLIKTNSSEAIAKGTKAGQSSKSIARFFSWRKGGSKSKSFEDDAEPSSAPPHVTTFEGSAGFPSPLQEVSPSLPTTPVGHHALLGNEAGQMPHRKTGPLPKSILRKGSAPALREQSRPWVDATTLAAMPRTVEAPGAIQSTFNGGSPQRMQQGGKRREPPTPLRVTPSRSTSSDLSRGYSGVGRGVARRSSDASSIIIASPLKSPRRKQVPRRFEDATNYAASRDLYDTSSSNYMSKVSNLGAMVSQHTLFAIDDIAEETDETMQVRRRSMAQRVVNGMSTHGFEEPAPRTTSLGQAAVDMPSSKDEGLALRANRRRSRSVGALDAPNPFASAFAAFNDGYSLSTPSALGLHPISRFEQDEDESAAPFRTPTQQNVATFQPSTSPQQMAYLPLSPEERRAGSLHRATDSGNSSSSSHSDDLSLSHATTVVATRRVQVVGTRAKATSISSPSMVSRRFTNSSSSNNGSSPHLVATPVSKKPHLQGPLVTVLPPTPDMPEVPAFAEPVKEQNSPVSSPLKKVESANDALRRTWSERNSCLFALKAATASLPPEEDAIVEEAEPESLFTGGLYKVNQNANTTQGVDEEDGDDDDDDDSFAGSLPYDFPTVPAVAPLNIKRKQGSKSDVSTASESNGSLAQSASNETAASVTPTTSTVKSKNTVAPRIPPSFSNESIMSGLDELDWHPLSYSDSQTVLPSITTSANLEYAAHVAAAAASKKRPVVPSLPKSETQERSQPNQATKYDEDEEMVDPHMAGLPSEMPTPPQHLVHISHDSITTSEFSNGSMPSLDSSDTTASSFRPARSQQRKGTSGLAASPVMFSSAGSVDSISSINTTGTSIFNQGASSEEVQRYLHRAQLSHDAFADRQDVHVGLAPEIKVREEVTPRVNPSAVWAQASSVNKDASPMSPLDVSPTYPSITVQDVSASSSPRLNFEPTMGEALGLSMLGPYEGKPHAPRVSSRRTGSRLNQSHRAGPGQADHRSLTPTQQRSPNLAHSGSQSSSSSSIRSTSPQPDSRRAGEQGGYGLGLNLGVGAALPATQIQYTPTRVIVSDSRARVGRGTWEEEQQRQRNHHHQLLQQRQHPRQPQPSVQDVKARSSSSRSRSTAVDSSPQLSPLLHEVWNGTAAAAAHHHEQISQTRRSDDLQQHHHHQLGTGGAGPPSSPNGVGGIGGVYDPLRESGEWEMGVAL